MLQILDNELLMASLPSHFLKNMKALIFIKIYLISFCVLFGQPPQDFSVKYKIIINENSIDSKDKSKLTQAESLAQDFVKDQIKKLKFLNDKNIEIYNLSYKYPEYSFNYVESLSVGNKDNLVLLSKDQFYGNKDMDVLYGLYSVGSEEMLVKYQDLSWQLKNEFEVIAGFRCQKAIATIRSQKFTIEAWFTSDLPQTSIFEFKGLPGTILKLKRGNITYEAFKVELKSKNIENILNKNLKIISFDEYEEISKSMRR